MPKRNPAKKKKRKTRQQNSFAVAHLTVKRQTESVKCIAHTHRSAVRKQVASAIAGLRMQIDNII